MLTIKAVTLRSFSHGRRFVISLNIPLSVYRCHFGESTYCRKRASYSRQFWENYLFSGIYILQVIMVISFRMLTYLPPESHRFNQCTSINLI